MTEQGPPEIAYRSAFRAPPSVTHWTVAVSMVFILGFGAPDTWFIDPAETETFSTTLSGLIVVSLAGFALMSVLHRLPELFKLLSNEWMLTAFFSLAVISVLWSAVPDSTIRQVVPLLAVVGFAAWLVMVFPLRHTVLIFGAAMALGTLLATVFVFALPRYGLDRSGNWIGLSENRNPFGREASFSFLIFLLCASIFKPYRWIWAPLAALAFAQVYFSTSKTSLVASLLLLLCFSVFRLFRARKTLYGAVATALIASMGLGVATATANLAVIADVLERDVTLTGRTELWAEAWNLAIQRPFLGWGFSGIWHGYFSPSHDILLAANWSPAHSHNAFLEYFLELGIVGVLLSIGIYYRAVTGSTRFVRSVGGESNVGLVPLMAVTFALLISATEVGAISRTAYFLFLVVAIFTVGGTEPASTKHLTDSDPALGIKINQPQPGDAFNAV